MMFEASKKRSPYRCDYFPNCCAKRPTSSSLVRSLRTISKHRVLLSTYGSHAVRSLPSASSFPRLIVPSSSHQASTTRIKTLNKELSDAALRLASTVLSHLGPIGPGRYGWAQKLKQQHPGSYLELFPSAHLNVSMTTLRKRVRL